MKNIKYYAGLFDADGSFDIDPTKRSDGSYYINIRATLYQKDTTVLEPLAQHFGVEIRDSKGCSCVALRGDNALRFMEQVKRHLVIKKEVVEFLIPIKGTKTKDIKSIRSAVQDARKRVAPEKNYPSRQWMAGYIDGDGCIHSSFRKSDGNIEFKLAVVSHYTQEAGLLLMQKAFGGNITKQEDVRKWNISLSISKGKQLFGFFGKHLRMKKQQADLVLDCLRSRKHLRREGATYDDNIRLHHCLQSLKLPTTTKSLEQDDCLVSYSLNI